MAPTDLSKTLSIRLTRFFMLFAGFWIWHDRRGKILMNLAMAYTIAVIVFAWIVSSSDLWFSRKSFYHGAYAACNAMTVLLILLKLTIFALRRDAFLNLIRYSYKNFWQRDYDAFGKNVLRNCETRCIYFVGTFTFFAQCTVCSYLVHSFIENIGKNETDRILLFKIWVDLPLTTTPYYEITFFMESLSLIHSGICYFCFDNLLCIINVHVAGQLKILQKRLESICEIGVFRNRRNPCEKIKLNNNYNCELKECVREHQSLINFVKMVEDVYTFVILGQVIIFSILVCLVFYQAVFAVGSIERRMIFIVHSAGTFTQLFMFTLTCDNLIYESYGVSEAVYRSQWYSSSQITPNKNFGKNLMIIMMRARRPCCLTAGGFFPISLETFTTIISTAISYLTLLRQGHDNLQH